MGCIGFILKGSVMTQWYSKVLGGGVAARIPSQKIHLSYLSHAIAHGQESGAAVFCRMDLHDNLVTAYFTPEAANLAAQFGAAPCAKPERVGRLSLLAGSSGDWSKHFPE